LANPDKLCFNLFAAVVNLAVEVLSKPCVFCAAQSNRIFIGKSPLCMFQAIKELFSLLSVDQRRQFFHHITFVDI